MLGEPLLTGNKLWQVYLVAIPLTDWGLLSCALYITYAHQVYGAPSRFNMWQSSSIFEEVAFIESVSGPLPSPTRQQMPTKFESMGLFGRWG